MADPLDRGWQHRLVGLDLELATVLRVAAPAALQTQALAGLRPKQRTTTVSRSLPRPGATRATVQPVSRFAQVIRSSTASRMTGAAAAPTCCIPRL